MPFGIATAPEEYQRRQHEVLEGLPGIYVIADDILITGQGESKEEALEDHDRNLFALLERAREVNLKGQCHAIWKLYKNLEGVFASTEFQN